MRRPGRLWVVETDVDGNGTWVPFGDTANLQRSVAIRSMRHWREKAPAYQYRLTAAKRYGR